MEEENLKKIAELREILEERIKKLETEIEALKIILEFANSILLEKSFRRVEEIPQMKAAEAPPAKIIPLKTSSGELLANIYVEEGRMRVVPEADKKFDVKTPPFESFLIDKVLAKMRDIDQEAVRKGEIMPEEALSFDLKLDGNIIREILIWNVSPRRERDLRSAIRWTLEKMYEKTRGVQS
jgi:hypothetical protein